jgi:hypothetical protein
MVPVSWFFCRSVCELLDRFWIHATVGDGLGARFFRPQWGVHLERL